jgi:tetratricopeptide (TPR) repeat protein
MVKRFLVSLVMATMAAAIVLPTTSYAVEGVSERQQRKKIEAQKLPNQAQEALNNNDPDRAIELFTKAIQSRAFDDQPDALGNLYFGRGNAYRRKSEWALAIADYTKALEYIKKGDVYFSRAACYLELKQEDLALADLDASVKTDPDAVSYRHARCILLFNRKDFAGALPDCEKALAATPNDKNLLTAAAQAAEQTGNPTRAAELYRRLLAADPGNPIATEGLQRTGGAAGQ